MQPLGTKRVSHLLVILALSVGGAILLFYYQVEFAARLHCPKKVVTDSKRYNHSVGRGPQKPADLEGNYPQNRTKGSSQQSMP